MSDPITAAAIIGTAGAVTSGVGTAMQGSQSPVGQIKLPPELEAQQLQIIDQQIMAAQEEANKASDLSNMLYERAQVMDSATKGFIPYSEYENTITKQNREIAEKYGAETLNVLGFEQQLRGKAEDILAKSYDEYSDPSTEREITQTKQILEEQMSRDFGPDWRNTTAGQRAMASFNESVSVMRNTAQEQKRSSDINALTGLTGIGTTLGQGVFQGAGFGQNYLMGNLNTMSELTRATASTATDIGKSRLEYGNVPFGMMQSFGQQSLSGDIKNYIKESGAGGMFPEFQTYGEYKRSGGWGEGFGEKKPPLNRSEYYQDYQWNK